MIVPIVRTDRMEGFIWEKVLFLSYWAGITKFVSLEWCSPCALKCFLFSFFEYFLKAQDMKGLVIGKQN